MAKHKLKSKILLEGIITAQTGLHIGGSNVGLSIGGADATVVRNPLNQEPYIPGSSLKGKLRSLLERLEGKFTKSGITQAGPYVEDSDDPICGIFGTTPEDIKKEAEKKYGKGGYKPEEHDKPISRLIVRDCGLTAASLKRLEKINSEMPLTEVKTEVVIDRITAAATPRQLERVPAGAQFNMRLVLNVYDGDDENALVNKIFQGLCLVQNDYLGGKGSRGSGEVRIEITDRRFKERIHYEKLQTWQKWDGVPVPDDLKPQSPAA